MNTYGTVGTESYGTVPTVGTSTVGTVTELPGKGKERGKMLARTDKEA